MFNVRDIIRNNNATFYDFDTRKRKGQRPRIVGLCLAAALMAILCPNVSSNLLAGFLAVQSILLGFTFNVMFFLVNNKLPSRKAKSTIEAKLRHRRLTNLYHELFYNVSYFNLVAVASIVIATALLLPLPEVPIFLRGGHLVDTYVRWLDTSKVPKIVHGTFVTFGMFVFYASALEVIYSIGRVIGRTSFYFERRMRDGDPSDPPEEAEPPIN